MASQGEREPGVLGMDEGLLESMVQDGDPEQDIGVQGQGPPQMDPEPEMGAATAAVYDTPLPSSTKTLPQSLPKRFTRVYPTWPGYSPCWHKWKTKWKRI